jgi:hypothetical protein
MGVAFSIWQPLKVLADCRRINVMSISVYKLDRYGLSLLALDKCPKATSTRQASDYVWFLDSAKLPINYRSTWWEPHLRSWYIVCCWIICIWLTHLFSGSCSWEASSACVDCTPNRAPCDSSIGGRLPLLQAVAIQGHPPQPPSRRMTVTVPVDPCSRMKRIWRKVAAILTGTTSPHWLLLCTGL